MVSLIIFLYQKCFQTDVGFVNPWFYEKNNTLQIGDIPMLNIFNSVVF